VSGARAPSPWLFVLALLLGLAATALLLARDDTRTPEYTDQFYATARLERFRGPGPVRVVALGSSLVGYGLAFDDNLEALGRAQGCPLRFIRFSHNGRSLDTVPPLLARLRQQPPDVLVMEAEWLAWGDLAQAEMSLRMRLKVRRRKLFLALRALLIGGRGNAGHPDAGQGDNHAPGGPLLAPGPPFEAGRYREYLRTFTPQDPQRLEEVLAALERLQQRGCRVVILAMGRSPEAAALFPAELAGGFQAMLDRLAARGFRVERPACPLPQACYLDEAHLNEQGRARLSAWFLSRVADWARP
jgi:hypothetical protein